MAVGRPDKEANLELPLFFEVIEESGLSIWLRESTSLFGFWFVLSFHAIGMGLLVGASAVIALRILGVAPDLPLAPLERLYRFIWVGFWIQVASGILLLIAYPTKALTNPDFYIKLALIGLAVTTMQMLKSRVFSDPGLSEATMMAKGKVVAAWSLIFWIGVVTSGRLLAYTFSYVSYLG
jgi:hypothetical protein